MVNFQEYELDRTFAALSDPTRRAMIRRLHAEPAISVSELARPFGVSLPAIMKHLDVLQSAGLVERRKQGRTVRCQLNPAPLEPAASWLRFYERFWTDRLDRLSAIIEEDAAVDDAPSLTITRRIKAPPARVFAAWTDPAQLRRWFGPQGVDAEEVDVQPQVGGRFRIVMRDKDGERHEVSGEYREIVPDQRLVFTWAWHSTPERQSLVTVVLQAADGATDMTLVHERFADEAARDRHQGGWSQSIERLAALFA